MKNFKRVCLLLLLLVPVAASAATYSGTVIDAKNKKPIVDAVVTLGNSVTRSTENGKFQISGSGEQLGIRAYGHLRQEITTDAASKGTTILLEPFTPKALYLSFYGIGDRHLRESALSLIAQTELNALVIDLKGDRGWVSFKSQTPLAAAIGAQKIITIRDLKALAADLHAKKVYTIARIVVFKDSPLASSRPDLAIKTSNGAIFRDREGLAWCNPYSRAVWDYNIDLAVEAARAGFDEIQFDYVRFPDRRGLIYPMPNTEANRVAAISGFFAEARKRLTPYNVFLSADIFGYVPWNYNDTDIGQKLENLAPVLDYMSFMLYPSGFQFGIPGYLNPVHHPKEIVFLTLEKAKQRTNLPALRFRPWLQAFRDYAFDRTQFGASQIQGQIEAADQSGSNGWMLWNPRNAYTNDGLRHETHNTP